MSSWNDLIATRLGAPVVTTGSEIRFNCYTSDCNRGHKDTGYHLYVNPDKNKFFCQRCQRGGTLEYLARILGLPQPERSLILWEKILHAFLFGNNGHETKEEEPVIIPRDYNPVFIGTTAYEYLLSRGISAGKMEYYNLGFGTKELKNRIIFPDYDCVGHIVYWVARTYGKHKAKYKNAKSPRTDKVYNLGRIQEQGYKQRIVICEGPISAIIAGTNAVATYGKYVTGAQISKLVSWNADEYVVAFDGDALGEAVSLATRLYRRRLNVRFVRFGQSEDPASVGLKEIRRRIATSSRWTDCSAMEVLL